MKTIAKIIIINSQNVKSEHLLAVIIRSVSKKKTLSPLDEFHRSRQQSKHWTAKSATGEPEIPQTPAS